jgi:hypothetical protein
MTAKMRRVAGEGSIRLRSDHRREGRVETGWTDEGKGQQRSVFAPTRQEAASKPGKLQQQLTEGIPTAEGAPPWVRF